MEDESRPSSPQAGMSQEPASTPGTDRRKSGRLTRRPELFSQSYGDATPGGAKRKRGNAGEDDEDAEEEQGQEPDDASESGGDEDEADEEELREKKRAARKKPSKKSSSSGTKSTAKPRTTKKARVASNGIAGQLALRPAANGKKPSSRPRKPKVRPSLAAGEHGLYGKRFLYFIDPLLYIY